MYGTVMIGTLAGSPQEGIEAVRRDLAAWVEDIGRDAGFVDELVLQADDGRVVMAVRFASREAYRALADDPRQDEWYRNRLRPLLSGDPEWIDGTWVLEG